MRCKNRAEVCCWLPRSKEQFRLRGVVEIEEGGEEGRRELWERIRPEARKTFDMPTPGEALDRTAHDDCKADAAEDGEDKLVGPVSKNFATLKLQVHLVDYLNLSNNRRVIWTKNEGTEEWTETPVNP